MAAYAKSLLIKLHAIAEVQNADILRDYAANDALIIWTEGGEWPAYSNEFDGYTAPSEIRNLNEIDYSYTSSTDDAIQYISSCLDSRDMVGISMDCGQGKSTHLVRAIHNLKYGKRTLVVQPSSLVAYELVAYLDRTDVTYVDDYRIISDARGLYYMSAGTLLSLIAANKLTDDDVVVMDEAHSATLVHSVVYDMLNRMPNYLIMMTASTTTEIKARKGVRLHKLSAVTNDVDKVTAQDSDALVIGVNDDSSYAFPASMLTGLTIPNLYTVYDTGLRPDPRTQYGSVFSGERKASTAELTQSMGRLGRISSTGQGYYVEDARPLRKQLGISLYTVMASVMAQTLGLTACKNRLLTVNVWKHSGILRPICQDKSHHSEVCSIGKRASGSIKLTAESLRTLDECMSNHGTETPVDALSQTREWCDNVSRRGESVSPSSTTARVNYRLSENNIGNNLVRDRLFTTTLQEDIDDVGSTKRSVAMPRTPLIPTAERSKPSDTHSKQSKTTDDNQKRRRSSLAQSKAESVKASSTVSSSRQRNSVVRQHVKTLSSDQAVKTKASARDANTKVDVHTVSMSSGSSRASGSSIAQKRVESRLMARKPTSKVVIDLDIERQINMSKKTKSGCLTLTTGIKMPNSRECIVNGNAAWARLFKKGADPVVPEGKIDSSLVRSYWESIIDCMYNYDSIFPSILPVVDPRQVTLKTIDVANKVIAFEKLPTYSEQEILSVIALWNKYVVSLRGRCAAYDRLYNFIDYFDSVYGFGHVTKS